MGTSPKSSSGEGDLGKAFLFLRLGRSLGNGPKRGFIERGSPAKMPAPFFLGKMKLLCRLFVYNSGEGTCLFLGLKGL
ncbi:hypothetical protein D1970_15650 [Mesobacillus zeae]|uniref:Uncharacterized protein n=1 Tax=Mesobacillus zeae TaxID=1917180 RepID=A0A398B0U6_9BACI|nr:hypothetical protein D1970_15650 [Mesobacillus zeae]